MFHIITKLPLKTLTEKPHFILLSQTFSFSHPTLLEQFNQISFKFELESSSLQRYFYCFSAENRRKLLKLLFHFQVKREC
ncbi:hypothetical protein FRX31_011610 [Thalictrum thalictroides]|uniref:Uncharacterized protein n=1 Tax=Thalictrum thalictroides TaxID=46969 RepID=A0A7J6WPD2_THATH|nr:hypothetical protein FRX31_011610 [Thalictrum thalictroides]